MAIQFEVEAVKAVLKRWADNKGVSSYVNDDEMNDLAIDLVEALDTARGSRKKRSK